MPLSTASNFAKPDDAFRAVVEAHRGLNDEQSADLDAALVLILANHIGDIEVLVRLAVEAGLMEHESRSALILRAGQDGVIAAERHATVLGITGVPTFIFDGQYTISGAQDVGTLARVLDQVADLAAAREVAS